MLPAQVGASVEHGIVVISGEFGSLGSKRKLDIAVRLRQLCGMAGDRCDVFCSETSFGLYRLGRRPICRVTYRCVDGTVKAIEAAREEPIMLRCDEDIDAEPEGPPPYTSAPGR